MALVPLDQLVLEASPRLYGQDREHVQRLAEIDAELPPILVQRTTMRVIDGAHRVRAAQLNGKEVITAHFYDGTDDDAFVISVERNVTHGMPLTHADRRAAVARIIRSHPHWSDRAVAARTGLSDRTVRAIRSSAELPQSNERLGLDGRMRPMNAADGRRRASEILKDAPTMPLRKVAKASGVSLATVHDVRQRMLRGDDPVPHKREANGRALPLAAADKPTSQLALAKDAVCLEAILARLTKDPSLKYTEAGRLFLRWLHLHAIDTKDLESFLDTMPEHCRQSVATIARQVASKWQNFACQLEHSEDSNCCRSSVLNTENA
ncbi:Chromosome segregation protein Spo0J, contains ParB-like nuclease domain [Nonomuraea solani]|uniref:Chromosome segregation protein Spo0J, contains ParB-like nuclease domain n=1 Tax=Nonomuraea solani TaxID=1144553 RepID=A0A1H6F349_9ACTN|nr:Chromosome segregation protein Spo0J, contains ParB-like nuclease domain [Nonomuraea solani]